MHAALGRSDLAVVPVGALTQKECHPPSPQ